MTPQFPTPQFPTPQFPTPQFPTPEEPTPEEPMTNWRKSSHSGGTGGDCVELVHTGTTVLVRDSKNPHVRPLRFPPTTFRTFLRTLRNG